MNIFHEAKEMPEILYRIKITPSPGGGFDVHVDSTRGSSVAFGVNRVDLPNLLNMCLRVELTDAGILP